MDKKQRTLKIIIKTAIGLFIGFFIWLLCVGIGTLFDFGQSNSLQSNSTSMSFIGLAAGAVIGGMFIYANLKWILKK
jgi:hypothetical protein